MTKGPLVAVTTSSFAEFSDEPLNLLKDKGFEPLLNPYGRTLSQEEAARFLQGCVGVVAGTEPLTAKVLEGLPGLKIISRCGAGIDSVDIEAASRLGVRVLNTPDGPTRAVAELTLALALDLMRHVSRMDREVRSGTWKKRMGNLLEGSRLGIIGFGRIGREVGRLFSNLGCAVAFYDPFQDKTPEAEKMDLAELLQWADIVSLHAAATPDSPPIINPLTIEQLKPGARLINVARGSLVDEEALCQALMCGRISGAALDVFSKEPYTGKLAGIPNVILTPHIGSYARESRIQMELQAVRNLLEALGPA